MANFSPYRHQGRCQRLFRCCRRLLRPHRGRGQRQGDRDHGQGRVLEDARGRKIQGETIDIEGKEFII